MPISPFIPRVTLAGLAAVALAAPAVHAAGSARSDLLPRTIKVEKAKPTGYAGSKTVFLSARVHFPRSFQVLASGSHLTLRSGSPACKYTTRVRTRMDVTPAGTTAAEHLLALTPGSGSYLLDEGTRGRMPWRVTRVRADRARLVAAAVVPANASQVRQLGLTAAQTAYRVVHVQAESRPGDECHTGSYRNSLGPQIGDALAISKTRSYVTLSPR